jgi:hypothetical protein
MEIMDNEIVKQSTEYHDNDDLADDTKTDAVASTSKSKTGCCSWTQFDGVAMAKGYNLVSSHPL